MPFPTELEGITGARELYDWFGYWPSFHDAEVVTLHLDRAGSSSLAVHTWEMTKEVDALGHYVLRKHVVVKFVMDDISNLSLEEIKRQNVVFGIQISREDESFKLVLHPCYGITGMIVARQLAIKITPGRPA